ncbi:MAG: DUF6807 domain-containing protein [Thermoguttaceae bacterium]
MLRTMVFVGLVGILGAAAVPSALAEITVEPSEKGAVVKVDGQLFTEYITGFATESNPATPILWPLLGPTGKPMTRSYPMAEGPKSERKDHPHHRSLWFNHGDVNGLSFWDREQIKHVRFVEMSSGPTGKIVTENQWVDQQGKVQCSDRRAFVFGANADSRWIDVEFVVKADEIPVKFGDTKEGSFGVRVAGTIKVDAATPSPRQGVPVTDPSWGGHIVNSEGNRDGDAWAKRAAWVDYYGPLDGQTLGIAILNHPSSFRYPTYWHVRTYGLFAANPFGLHDFENDKAKDGSHTLKPGQSMTFRYRVLLHQGDEKIGKVQEVFDAYAAENK